jgi:hypothetical protein
MVCVAAVDAVGNRTPRYGDLAIPFVGPLLLKNRQDRQGFALYGSAPEVAGLALLVMGIAVSSDVWVRDWRQTGVSLSPVVSRHAAGLGFEGTW